MHVLVGAFGTRGDVQPMLALSQVLVQRGHTVSLATPPNSVSFARQHGVDALGVGLDYEDISKRVASGNFGDLLKALPLLRQQVEVQLEALEPHAQKADVIVGSPMLMVGSILAEKAQRPYVFVSFCPQLLVSNEHPCPSLRWQGLPRWANRLSWNMFDWFWEYLLGESLRKARERRALPPIDNAWATILGDAPIVACDPLVAPVPSEFTARIHQVGAFVLNDSQALSPQVEAFLQAGTAPLYIGFGSMSDASPGATTRRIIEAVRTHGRRAIISRGWAGLGQDEVGPDILFVGPEPHDRLFPRCVAVVHHGGAGTTHAAARAGVPQVVLPQLLDQHYWAHRVHLTGLGPPPVARYSSGSATLAKAMETCLHDLAMQANAKRVAASMHGDGTERAVDLLEQMATRGPTSGSGSI